MTICNRRQLLAAGGTCAGLAVAAPLAGAAHVAPGIGHVPWRMSLAAYSLREYLERPAEEVGAMAMWDVAKFAAEQGFDAIEPTSYYFREDDVETEIAQLKGWCLRMGLDISGGAIRNNFTLPPGPELDREFAHVGRWVALYSLLGAPVIRVFAGKPPAGMGHDQAVANAVANLQNACETAGKHGVTLALENHDFLMDPARMMEIVEGVDSMWFGVNWDSGNFHTADPYADLARLAPYAVNAQIKVEMIDPAGRKSSADLPRLLAILRDAEYRGAIVLEYEAADEPREAIPRYAAELRAAMEASA